MGVSFKLFPRAVCLVLVTFLFDPCQAVLSCFTDGECAAKLREGSTCIDGTCSNPFVKGCIATLKGDSNDHDYDFGIRACNSDDIKARSPDCHDYAAEFDYPEIRIHNSNWESSIFNAWIMQILLMEVLKVPTTVGLTPETTPASSFYSPTNTLQYSAQAYPWDGLRKANTVGRCETTGEPCVHVMPEVWIGQEDVWTDAVNNGVIEPVEGNGQVGKISWYIPSFAAKKDPSLTSFYGLQGEQNRHKLAEEFKTPTTWKQYCEQVSPDNCTTPDEAAQGYPEDGDEDNFYAPPGYMGHFRILPENNCTAFPDTCQGNFIAPPCTWSTNIDSQLWWNDIKLRPNGPLTPYGGYGYSAMIQVWRAAVHTKSTVIMWWWRPEALTEEFYGTDGQFQQVLLPETTHACSRNRIPAEDRCSADISLRRGDELGSCDQEAHALRKLISMSLKEDAEAQPAATRSPGYEMIKNLKVTDLEMDNMLTDWILRGVDPYGNDAREAVCGWVSENLDELMRFVPPGYPKELSQNSPYNTTFMHAATAVAAFAAIVVLITAAFAFKWRQKKVFIYAQSHIVFLILIGFFFITIGAILKTLTPTDSICVAQAWLVNLGYTIELVPTLVKVAAINKILTSAKKMKRVKITKQGMMLNVVFVLIPVLIYLLVWTIIDPPRQVEQRVLSEDDATIIETSLTCKSENDVWFVVALCWQALLLLAATVLAFQSRDIVQDFNESRSLGTMIYSHFLFMALRGITFNLGTQEILLPNAVAGVTSGLLSFDTLFAIIIYLVPKCVEARTGVGSANTSSSASDGRGLSSVPVSQVQANAIAAGVSFLSTGQFAGNGDSKTSSRQVLSSRSRSRRPSSRFSSKFEDIPEGPNESSSKDGSSSEEVSRASSKESRLSSGSSFRLDPAGSIVSSEGPASVSKKRSSNQSTRSSGFSSASLTTSQLERLNETDEDSSDDEKDLGGPRFTCAAQNERLEKSVRGGPESRESIDLELEALAEEGSELDESTSTNNEVV